MRAFLPFGLAVAATVAACGSEPVERLTPEVVGHGASPIINGTLDTTHQAVVAIVMQNGSETGMCTGSIIKVDPVTHVGWVLTAAHCVDIAPTIVLQGDDASQASSVLRYEIVDYKADPAYSGKTGTPHDFAMIRIAGVDATTPVLPIVGAADGLSTGTPVVSVGYGRTTLISAGEGAPNWRRRSVSKTLSVVEQELVAYNMSSSGVCQGDSGGPVLVKRDGVETVAAIHSFVQGDCNGTGVSGRVSFGLDFINGELEAPSPTVDCALCEKSANSGNGVCVGASRRCIADAECKGYYECLQAGSSAAKCVAKFPNAEALFNTAANCTCTTACASTCGTSLSCQNAPKCGYKIPAGDCATCTEGSCCAETLACAGDTECYLCLKNKDGDAACATNALRKSMATCVANRCTTQCAGSGLETGAELPTEDAGAAPAAATTVTTTSGCSIATAGGTTGAPYLLAAVVGGAAALARRRRRLHN